MAKPGPRPKPKEELRSVTIGVRVTPALRAQLEQLAEKNDWTLGEECAARLRESLDADRPIRERFGSETVYWLFRVLAEQIGALEQKTGVIEFDERAKEYRPGRAWHKHPFTFQQARAMINTVLDYLAPRGKPEIPKAILHPPLFGEAWARALGEDAAKNAIAALEVAIRQGGSLKLPGFVDTFAAGRHIQPKLTRSALDDIGVEYLGKRKSNRTIKRRTKQ